MKFMFKLTATSISILLVYSAHAQNVGIGTVNPLAPLHVVSATTEKLRLENTTTLAANISNEMYFKTGSWFTGAIKTTGASSNTARMSFYTFASGSTSGLNERMSILDNGIVGIGNIAPSLAGLSVDNKVGAVNAIFGSTDIGVAIESNFPGVAFNSYYNGSRTTMTNGYGGLLGMNPVTGEFYIQTSSSSLTGGTVMPLFSRISISNSGRVGIGGPSTTGSMLQVTPSFGTADIEVNAQVSGGDNAILRLNKNGTGNYSAIRFKNLGTVTWDLGTQGTDEFRLAYTPNNVTVLQVDNVTRRVGIGTNGYNAELNVAGGIYDYNDMTVMGNQGIGIATPQASLHVLRGTAPNGTAEFEGTTYASHFNYSTTEDTYIRGGKATSNVFINDLSSGVVGIAAAGGKVGVGTNTPSYPFTVQSNGQGITQTNGTVVAGLYLNSNSAYLQTVTSHPLYFATGNGSAQMAILTNGNVGIGTSAPTSKLQVVNAAGNALEISGGIKVSGNNKPAFVLTCDATNLTDNYNPPVNYVPGNNYHGVYIDNALSNGDPNAIILITSIDYAAPFTVSYDTNVGKWKIKINSSGADENSCYGLANPQGGACGAYYVSVMGYSPQLLNPGNKFNVLIIKQ